MKDDGLIGRCALASVQLVFPGLGINITLTCLQAVGIYPHQAGSKDSTLVSCKVFNSVASVQVQFHQSLSNGLNYLLSILFWIDL
jgi:hypothetical protein